MFTRGQESAGAPGQLGPLVCARSVRWPWGQVWLLEKSTQSSQHRTDQCVLSCLVWSVFNRKAEGLAETPGISHKESNTKRTGDILIQVQ